MTTARRKHISMGVKLHAALLLLGFTDEEIAGGIAWDHDPPLALRFVDPETGRLTPDANDPHHLQPLRTAEHRTKTSGRRGEKRSTSYGSDAHAIAKVRRNEKANAEFMRAVSTKGEREKPATAKPKRPWPKQTFRKRTAR